jgi:membrane associated rhomboid family serine protease
MFVPLHDSTPLKIIRFQAVTITIIAIEVVVYLTTGAFTSDAMLATTAAMWGVVPGEVTGMIPPILPYDPVPEPFTLISYQFLHGGWWHLISNMLFLWVFADNIEDAYGHVAFALLYLTTGVIAAVAHVLVMPSSAVPLVGASGAVSGILGAYLVLFPKARVWILLFLRLPLRIGALWVLGGWFGLQIVSWWMTRNSDNNIAWGAHVGGFLAGAAITYAIRRRLWMRLEGA